MSGKIIQGKAKELLQKMYGETNPEFIFSSGWLERFKATYGIKSYRHFGESADHSLATKQLEGRKKDKERITVIVCCNGDGSDKIPLWVIGKYANPRCFKNVNMNNLNCKYRSNKKAWMTVLLFQDFVGWFEKRMNGRKVLLLANNCPAHPKTTTIASCFRHCKIRSEENNVPEPEVGELDEGIQGLNDVIFNLHYRNVMDVEHFLNYPSENDAVMESPTDEEITQLVMNSNDDENDPELDDSSVVSNVSSKDAFQAIVTLSNYLLQYEQIISKVVYALQKVKDVVHFGLSGKKKQSTIDAYFQKE
ncbi:CENP-B homolog protein 1-like [Olea europaea var. sylvestris]|uniref:CENP-B homolog protein 1-like n=1 Tax=Olea europaea var. sylvestris TaxID=158386 RepID=UPI000C1CE53B|nr:CENP-B homolog protein 1-like [Olea europaea var. sylvestris]